ncbi:hypothetical protein FRC02_000592 [Tulasnella sp. 418]|nr:hypothetical protein FRC02_000592 [Tulasnella sp. 418]
MTSNLSTTLGRSMPSITPSRSPEKEQPPPYQSPEIHGRGSSSKESTPTKSPQGRKTPAAILTTTTTTTTIRTTTTTHFWRRRSSALVIDDAQGSSNTTFTDLDTRSRSAADITELEKDRCTTPKPSKLGIFSKATTTRVPSVCYQIDKDLPQLPAERPLPAIAFDDSAEESPSNDTSISRSKEASSGSNTTLGEGLQMVLTVTPSSPAKPHSALSGPWASPTSLFMQNSPPHARLPSSPSVTFAPSAVVPRSSGNSRAERNEDLGEGTSNQHPHTVRRARSFHSNATDVPEDPAQSEELRKNVRKRRISVGSVGGNLFGGSSPDLKGKGKSKDISDLSADDSKKKPLARKSSFWSRKRVDSTPNPPTRSEATSLNQSPAPARPSITSTAGSFSSNRWGARTSRGTKKAKEGSTSELPAIDNTSHERASSQYTGGRPSLPDVRPTSPMFADVLTSTPFTSELGLVSAPWFSSFHSSTSVKDDSRQASTTPSRQSTPLLFSSPNTSATSFWKRDSSGDNTPWEANAHPSGVSSPSKGSLTSPAKRRISSEANDDAAEGGRLRRSTSNSSRLSFVLSLERTRQRSMSLLSFGGKNTEEALSPSQPRSSIEDSPFTSPPPSATSFSTSFNHHVTTLDTSVSGSETPDVTVTRSPSNASGSSAFQRRRSNTTSSTSNPHLLRRLSQGFFTSTFSSPNAVSAPTSRHGSSSNLLLSPPSEELNRSRSEGRAQRSRSSAHLQDPSAADSSAEGSTTPGSSAPLVIPKPRIDEETPERYLERLMDTVSKAEIASILASSATGFYTSALRAYISRFDFTADPLDVALRKLLMDLSLPKETQQIDRVMEAFAKRYDECNPGLFVSDDQPYILAFSLMMLHTDAFNKNNKNKMTKAAYVKNTRLPGLPSEVLDCYYDNIVFAPFIFIEDPMDVNGQRGFLPEGTLIYSPISALTPPSGLSPMGNGGSTILGKPRIDPYYLITRKLLVSLREDVEAEIPQANPFLYTGTVGSWDEKQLQTAFAAAEAIQIVNRPPRKRSTAFVGDLGDDEAEQPLSAVSLKVTKFGVIGRKEDTLSGGKRSSNRKWKEWSVLLTGSQLLFFKDPTWAANLLADAEKNADLSVPGGKVPFPRMSSFHPDEVLSVKDSVALFERTYTRRSHTFRFIMPGGRHYLMQASDESSMNEWIALINYASAFKSAGIRMRPLAMTGEQARSTGTAAALSHVNDMRRRRLTSFPSQSSRPIVSWSTNASTSELSSESVDELPGRQKRPSVTSLAGGASPTSSPFIARRSGVSTSVELDHPEIDATDRRLEDTFFEIKAELAAATSSGLTPAIHSPHLPVHRPVPRAVSLGSLPPDPSESRRISEDDPSKNGMRRDSRAVVIKNKIRELESKISAAQSGLDADIRMARNLAVLSPFQTSTRERLLQAIPALARRIRSMRMEIAQLVCHRDVLHADVIAEESEWQKTLGTALSAATEQLKQKNLFVSDPLPELKGRTSIPRMTLSVHKPGELDPTRSPSNASSTSRIPLSDSSKRDSFYSAQSAISSDHGSPLSGANRPSLSVSESHSQLTTPAETDEPGNKVFSKDYTPTISTKVTPTTLENSAAVSPHTTEPRISISSASPTSPTTITEPIVDQVIVEEEKCEEWHKTKAAKRVSLAALPSERKLSTLSILSKARSLRDENRIDENTTPTMAESAHLSFL